MPTITGLYIFFVVILIAFSRRIRCTRHQKTVLAILFALSLATIAFYVEPPWGWDLTRHFYAMNEIRNSNLTLAEFLFRNTRGIGGYKTLFCFNFIRYILCRISHNNHWLPFFCVLIDYTIIGYIMIDWHETNGFSDKINITEVLLCTTLLPPIFAVSGLRNALAAAIMGLGIYLYLYKKKSISILLLLSFISGSIHQVTIISIPFVLLAKLKFNKIVLILTVLFPFLINRIVPFLVRSNVEYIRSIATAYLYYSSDVQYRSTIWILLGVFIIIIAFVLIYLCLGHYFEQELFRDDQKELYLFLLYYMCFILGNLGNYDLVLRPSYLLGVFAPCLAVLIENKKIWRMANGEGIREIGQFLCTAMCLLACYTTVWHIIPQIRV